MAETERETLIAQLSASESVAERRQAAKRLGKLRDPAAINALVNAYLDENEDESVRRAAENALRIFRRMQQERAEPDSPPAAAEPDFKALQKFRKPLTISLVVLIALNAFLFLIRALSGYSLIALILNPPTPVLATERTALILEAQDYLLALENEIIAFRQPLLDLKVDIDDLRRLPTRCTTLAPLALKARLLSAEDTRLNADVAAIFERLNSVLQQFAALRQKYTEACSQKDLNALLSGLAPSGGAGLVEQLDGLRNNQLSALRNALEVARTAPTPTIAPTAVVNLAPPTATPQGVPTATFALPTPEIAQPLAQPTAALGFAATAPVPTALFSELPLANISYQGVRLEQRARYRYRLTVDYEALVPPNRTLRGALSLRVLAENSATPQGRYEISLRDNPEINAFLGWLPEPFYRQGNAFYTALNGVFYHTGAGLPSQTLCTATPLSQANIGVLASLNVDALIERLAPPEALRLWREAPPVGVRPQYRAESVRRDEDGLEINLTATLTIGIDGLPEELVIRETRQAPAGYAKPFFKERTLTYTLIAADVAVNLAEVAQSLEFQCRNVTPRP
ncbi:MAG: hypothetical protein CUN49_05185 [Candidatus Thermofonsia Clade 1 bacterium]|jgi:hypothetical protein|uniref:HEAT repeat domain-containing protein n=1 Tax=Candidatus Thermofonsia Clade 1 bacterium TaxID=2364210 RepID=A0A2M8PG26_9CHLR|nr:MAG: hypothetical protein CUN49_05185 [Candidatus Thermofonsia Clade 1 bacterium]PJF42865.1 MAG: hypothetical protein CUN50_02395 [Candidatus Thermofonsia Clade 1 bacterium]RMF50510.1 MAG: hypothetical protein D6749_10410 [Chloroflexota bacterium]